MNYTKEEVLALSDKTEYEQKQSLIKWWIMDAEKYKNNNQSGLRSIESLADCAFRLRDECDDDIFSRKTMWLYYTYIFPELIETKDIYAFEYALLKSRPIHWIQAALLAKIESGE